MMDMYRVTSNNITIYNSWEYRRADMKLTLEIMRSIYPTNQVLLNRTDKSLMREWTAHNRLYRLGIARYRTKDVDLNWPQPWYARLGYFVLGI